MKHDNVPIRKKTTEIREAIAPSLETLRKELTQEIMARDADDVTKFFDGVKAMGNDPTASPEVRIINQFAFFGFLYVLSAISEKDCGPDQLLERTGK